MLQCTIFTANLFKTTIKAGHYSRETNMSNNKFWNEDWMKLQQQYWQQWGDMSRNAMGSATEKTAGPYADWDNAMSHWWNAVMPAMSGNNQAFMEKMLEQGKLFYRMGDTLTSNLEKNNDWTEALTKTFEQLQGVFASQAEKASGAAEEGFQKMMGFMQTPMESWRQMTGFMDFNNDFAHTPNLLEKLLDAPGLG